MRLFVLLPDGTGTFEVPYSASASGPSRVVLFAPIEHAWDGGGTYEAVLEGPNGVSATIGFDVLKRR